MRFYPEAAMEKAMTRQEIILRAYAKKLTWIQAAEIPGISARHLRRIKQKYDEFGFHSMKTTSDTKTSLIRFATREPPPQDLKDYGDKILWDFSPDCRNLPTVPKCSEKKHRFISTCVEKMRCKSFSDKRAAVRAEMKKGQTAYICPFP